jgi:hypothetical protein
MSIIDLLRTPKIAGFVLFDWTATLLSAMIVDSYFGDEKNINILSIFIILLILSLYLHVYFDIPTTTNYYLGLSSAPKRDI